MGIKDALESLDELVLAQYEKVNQCCHRRFGTDKYDLAHYAETVAGMGLTAMGVYYITSEYLRAEQISSMGMIIVPLGYAIHWLSKKKNSRERQRECSEFLKSGALRSPDLNVFRPAMLALSGVTVWSATVLLTRTLPTEILFKHPTLNSSNQALGSALVGGAIYVAGMTSGNYFTSTSYTPPTAKKNPLKLLYHSIASVFHKPELKPQENEYSLLEQLSEEGLLP